MIGARVEKLVADCAAATHHPTGVKTEGTCDLTHVRLAPASLARCKPAPGAAASHGQPHFAVATAAPEAKESTHGVMMFDTGAMVTIVTLGWVEAHQLKVKILPATDSGYFAGGLQ